MDSEGSYYVECNHQWTARLLTSLPPKDGGSVCSLCGMIQPPDPLEMGPYRVAFNDALNTHIVKGPNGNLNFSESLRAEDCAAALNSAFLAGASAQRKRDLTEQLDKATVMCECGHIEGEHYYPMGKWCKHASITDHEASNAEYGVMKCGCLKFKAKAIESQKGVE